jgi:DNA invertase Pin-like site-specific DNA recombinase
MRIAAIYARVSSEQQREANTIASQTAALIEFAKNHDLEVPKEWVFEDDGYSGATLERPGLEGVRDLAAEGQIQVATQLTFLDSASSLGWINTFKESKNCLRKPSQIRLWLNSGAMRTRSLTSCGRGPGRKY